MPRFVLLRHECPPGAGQPSHWDLMLERDGELMTWRLVELPAAWLGGDDAQAKLPLAAERIADHRRAYLDYEGPLTAGRGQVTRHDQGEYEIIEENAANLRVRLSGKKIQAIVMLTL